MEKNKPKVVDTTYFILVNNEIKDGYASLAQARKEIKNMNVDDSVQEVKIIKQTTSQTLIDSYKPKVSKTLTVQELSWD